MCFQFLNYITCIFIHVFTDTYFQKNWKLLFKHMYQTGLKYFEICWKFAQVWFFCSFNTFFSCFGVYIFCELVKAYNNFNTVKEKNLHFVLLLGFRWKACKRVTWTLRLHWVHEFKHMFSIFKQYNMYFHTLFHPHVFPKKLKIVV